MILHFKKYNWVNDKNKKLVEFPLWLFVESTQMLWNNLFHKYAQDKFGIKMLRYQKTIFLEILTKQTFYCSQTLIGLDKSHLKFNKLTLCRDKGYIKVKKRNIIKNLKSCCTVGFREVFHVEKKI